MSYIREALKEIQQLPSPNVVQTLVIGRDFVYARFHMPVQGKEALLLPFDSEKVMAESSESPMYILKDRVYGTLEDLVLDESYTDDLILQEYAQKAFNGQIRLKSVVPCDNAIEVAVALDEGATGEQLEFGSMFENGKPYYSRYSLQPEHYDWDVQAKSYFQELESRLSGVSSSKEEVAEESIEEVEEPIEEVVEEPTEEQYNLRDAVDYYAAHIDTVVSDIISNYTKLFKAGYQLKRPVGVLGEQGDSGKLMTLSGSSQTFTKPNPVIRALYQLTVAEYDLKILPYRSVDHIASIIVNGVTPDGVTISRDTRLYFPYKMLEFAYGRKTPKATEGGKTNYPKHSDKLNWEAYAHEVDANLRQVTTGIVAKILGNFQDVEYFDSKVESSISESLSRFKDVFTTCILVGEFPLIKGLPSLLKVRTLLPYELHNNYNVATEAMKVGISSLGTDPFEGFPIHDGVYHMYTHEYNHALANSKPMYAYHAAKSLRESGHEVNYKNMIIGMGLDDSILQNGSGKVNLVPNMSHFLIAGSRAGKGVDSMAKLAAALKSGKPVFYLDNKPDIGAVLLDIEPNSFVVNGQLVTSCPLQG